MVVLCAPAVFAEAGEPWDVQLQAVEEPAGGGLGRPGWKRPWFLPGLQIGLHHEDLWAHRHGMPP